MHTVAKLICAIIEVFTLLSFKDKWMIVEFPLVMAIFALLFFTAFLNSTAVLRKVKDLVEMSIWITSAIAIDKSVLSEGLIADDGVRTKMLFEI